MKSQCQIEPTHIDGLPKDIVENILLHLPIQDAVRTSILSRKWRYVWTKLPQLVFDDKFCEESIMKTESKIIKAINQVILLHQGPLNKFELSLHCLNSSYSELDQFVLVVLRKGVKHLKIRFPRSTPYTLPSSLFAYGQQLENLLLQCCVFKPPSGFNGFSKLETLLLGQVDISGSRFSSLISHCPVLKSLTFVSSTRCSPIDIVAPNLECLRIHGLCQPLYLKDTPKLATIDICCGYQKDGILKEIEASSQSILCGRLPVVKELGLDSRYLEYVATDRVSILLIRDLRHLKKLSLINICFGSINNVDDVSAALRLIRNFPNLEELEIYVLYMNDIASEVDLAEDVSLDHLKKVELGHVSGLTRELQFIKFTLAKSPVLEKFLISLDLNLVGDEGSKFFKELSTFRRLHLLLKLLMMVEIGTCEILSCWNE